MPATRLKYLTLVACAGGMMLFAYGRIDPTDPRYADWDLHDYRAMAESAPSFNQDVRQPFVFRVLGPCVAGLMPFSTDTNFLVISMLSGILLSLLLYLYLSKSLVSPAIAALTTVFFLLNKYWYGFTVWNYFQINDLLSQIAILLLLWAMNSQKWPTFGIILFLGSFAKELPLLMVPVAALFALQSKPGKPWLPIVLAILPGFLAAIILRLLLHSGEGNNLFDAFLAYDQKLLSAETWFRLLINSVIPFSLIPVVFFKSTRKYFQTRTHELVFVLLVILSTFFGYNNERLMAPAFIVFYPLLAFIIQEEIAGSKMALGVLFGGAVLAALHHTYARYPLPREWTIPVSLSALAGVTMLAISHKWNSSRINLKQSGPGDRPA